MTPSHPPSARLSTDSLRRRSVPWLLGGLLLTGACAADDNPAPAAAAGSVPPCPAAVDGYFRASLRGAVNADPDWRGAALACDGMQRPDGAGGRLYFGGELAPDARLVIVVGIDGLTKGVTGREFDANVTLVLEDQGWFFGSQQQSGCWADVDANTAVDATDGGYRVSGQVYCVRGLPAIGGDSAVTVTALEFAGVFRDDDDDE